MLQTTLRLRALPGCGAMAEGIDLAAVDRETAGALRRGLFEHGVLFFRDQTLSPEDHIRLAELIAPIDVNRFFPADSRWPMIAKVEKTAEQQTNIGGGWHTDHSYDVAPAMGSILVARELPPSGGDTLFADMYAAYETLDEETKREVATLRAVHGSDHVFGEKGAYTQTDQPALARGGIETPESVHPVVIRHPGSGKKVLYVNPGFTLRFEGRTREESLPLLMKLFAHAMDPARVYRFAWRPGSVAMWDNRATWHFALNDYHGHYRLMHRITLGGEPLQAA
ncbi:MAG: TauD/TfdA family dioxygenase [Alphaproteobacteria bacterium]|nr:TauD/TfdA family dioxygenase [Alphaproteobacteria bacterium]